MTPDVNVLIAASRSNHPHHRIARRWLEGAASSAASGGSLTLMPTVIASFLRLVTSPQIFPDPTPVNDAIAFIDALLSAQSVQMASLGPEWPRLRQLCIDKRLAGNAIPDAWLAAATIHLGEHLVSFDRGLKKLMGRSQLTVLEADVG